MQAPTAPPEPGEASTQVVESAIALFSAEVRLFGSVLTAFLERAGISIFFGWLAASCGQLVVTLIVLAPILIGLQPRQSIVWSIGLGIGLTCAAAGAAFWALRSARALANRAAKPPGNDPRLDPQRRQSREQVQI